MLRISSATFVRLARLSDHFAQLLLAEMAPWTLQRLERAVENFSDQLQCAICLCAYDNPVSLPCNHCFCEECIHRALELKAQCPICKTPAKKRRLRYDTTVQELLRATEMLCAAPDPNAAAAAPKTPSKTEKRVKKELTQVKVATPVTKVAAGKTTKVAAKTATPEKKMTPRRGTKRNSQKSPPSTPTLMDKWVTGGSVQLKNGFKIKKEKPTTSVLTPVRRRAQTQEINSQVAVTQMSPPLFEISSGDNAETTDAVDENKLMPWRRRPNADVLVLDNDATDTAMDETQLDAAECNSLAISPRRRRNTTDVVTVDTAFSPWRRRRRRQSDENNDAVDAVVAETQLETVEMEQQETPTRRRRSDSNGVAMDETVDETQLEAVEPKYQKPTPRKRRRSPANGVATDDNANGTVDTKQQPVPNGKIPVRNGSAESPSLIVDSQAQPLPEVEVFQVGDLVDVIERQWVGINKRGGAGRITKVHGDGFYAVKFVIGSGSDSRVPGTFIRRPTEDLVSDSTPSRAVRKRQRRRPSDTMVSPDLLTIKTKSSPHSTTKKTKTKSIAIGKHSGMVFLCSGFKEDRMQQIDEWAELLGAEVVHYWSNDVTHLIVKCVSGDEIEKEGPSMDDSNSESSPQAPKNGKRQLFGDRKSGRWVKIRSLKYLKALVGGRWIVSDEWLQACADHGGYVSEVNYEADGHWKGRRIHDAVKRSRLTREKLLQLSSLGVDRSNVGTMLFADFCFHVIGEFLPPMPPVTELNTLICMGGGKLIAFLDEIREEMHKRENRSRKLIIVSDKLNPTALRQQTKQLKAKPQLSAVSSAVIVNYLWVINSISEAKLRELP
ncbi:hypothetical protein L914_08094 [Phytophthora nicotianae]|uniref:RING-type E3 ubiquitin transferase BRCA1 n=1 Tax=Phytophthora nicotianae TaxID=4792 RepID=W2NF69_PHYNI|nr:hypothetical protein L914_08094 [Phytophthora nicotianae]